MNNNFLAGFIIGCLIGAAVALVLAPMRGAGRQKRVAMGAENQVISTQYEAPRIVLDEGINASGLTGSENG
jgi:gas vesicle protein